MFQPCENSAGTIEADCGWTMVIGLGLGAENGLVQLLRNQVSPSNTHSDSIPLQTAATTTFLSFVIVRRKCEYHKQPPSYNGKKTSEMLPLLQEQGELNLCSIPGGFNSLTHI
jgi:hypothetical protein